MVAITQERSTARIYSRKSSCPRNFGRFYCKECLDKWSETNYNIYPPSTLIGCGKEFSGLICGKTHLGYGWCAECVKAGRDVREESRTHYKEFESMVMHGPWEPPLAAKDEPVRLRSCCIAGFRKAGQGSVRLAIHRWCSDEEADRMLEAIQDIAEIACVPREKVGGALRDVFEQQNEGRENE